MISDTVMNAKTMPAGTGKTLLIDYHMRATIQRALKKWYDSRKRDLPWRRTDDPYAIWVSEVMLQQTQVNTVIPYYRRFMTRFPSVAHLARAEQSDVLKLWEGLGYYSRARNLHKAAKYVISDFTGRIPDTWNELRALPGIGDYIAAAVLSIAFHQPFAVVDGNVKRVLSRLRCIAAPVNDSAGHGVYQSAAGQLLCTQQPADHNQAMMELGALVCTARKPRCHQCPLVSFCCSRLQGTVADFPKRKPKKAVPLHIMVAGVIMKNNHILIVQRPVSGLLGGMWEFPNGPLDGHAHPDHACARHIHSQINLKVDVDRLLATVHHAYTHFKLQLSIFGCRWRGGRVRLADPVDFAWVRPDQIKNYALHKAVHKALPHVFTYSTKG
jgi:A/G-specific adenine glycosylase